MMSVILCVCMCACDFKKKKKLLGFPVSAVCARRLRIGEL